MTTPVIRTTLLADALAALLLAAVLLAVPGIAFGQGGGNTDAVLDGLRLDGLSVKEQERIRTAAVKLMRIRKTVGDPGRGETSQYLKSVEELARFLKRGTVEEVRRLTAEAENALHLVDRDWIDQAFRVIREQDVPITANQIGRLTEQKTALQHVGDLVRRAQAIPARQKRLETTTERGYRNLIRLAQESHHTLESIDHPPTQADLEWIVHEIEQVLATEVRPAHDRQERLLAVHQRVMKRLGGGKGRTVVRIFREYSSKLMVIERRVKEIRGNSD